MRPRKEAGEKRRPRGFTGSESRWARSQVQTTPLPRWAFRRRSPVLPYSGGKQSRGYGYADSRTVERREGPGQGLMSAVGLPAGVLQGGLCNHFIGDTDENVGSMHRRPILLRKET